MKLKWKPKEEKRGDRGERLFALDYWYCLVLPIKQRGKNTLNLSGFIRAESESEVGLVKRKKTKKGWSHVLLVLHFNAHEEKQS